MDYKDLFYTPQDIARVIFEMDLGAQKQEPFIRTVWEKECAFISPEWRNKDYKTFYQTVARFLDGCVDVEDKKKDIAFWQEAGKDNPKVFFSESNYINDFSKLKFYFFKELRLKLLFFSEKQTFIYKADTLLEKCNSDIVVLEQILFFYRLTCFYYKNAVQYTSIQLAQKEGKILYFTLKDEEGIYDNFFEMIKKVDAIENEEENGNELVEDSSEDNTPFDTEMYITAIDLLDFFKKMQIKQKGKNNQLQFINYLTLYYNDLLAVSDPYISALKIFDDVKECSKSEWNKRKYSLIKYIKLYVIRTDECVIVKLWQLLDDVKLDYSDNAMNFLNIIFGYYGLVLFDGDNVIKFDTSISLQDNITVGDISFLE